MSVGSERMGSSAPLLPIPRTPYPLLPHTFTALSGLTTTMNASPTEMPTASLTDATAFGFPSIPYPLASRPSEAAPSPPHVQTDPSARPAAASDSPAAIPSAFATRSTLPGVGVDVVPPFPSVPPLRPHAQTVPMASSARLNSPPAATV